MLTTIAITDTSMAVAQDDARQASSQSSPYHELAQGTGYQADVLVQLKANIAQLEDLHARMKFMMGEISYLLKRS